MSKKLIYLALVSILCAQGYVAAQDWEGDWNSTFGKLQVKKQKYNGQQYVGVYGSGIVHGAIEIKNGEKMLSGTFVNKNNGKTGVFQFNAPSKGEFIGKWVWSNSASWQEWSGSKIKHTSSYVPSPPQFYTLQPYTDQETDYQVELYRNGIRIFSYKGFHKESELYLPPGDWELKITKNGYVTIHDTIHIGPNPTKMVKGNPTNLATSGAYIYYPFLLRKRK
ncbi:MAG: hypothetical protein AB3N16_07400 [Flavobacteriaceae bacterium]